MNSKKSTSKNIQMATPELVITEGGRERVFQTAALLAETFTQDPVITYLLHTMPTSKRLAFLPQYFKHILLAAALNSATFLEASSFQSILIMIPPGKKVDNPWTMLPAGLIPMSIGIGLSGSYRMIFEYPPMTERCKAKGLRGVKDYYYVFFAATKKSEEGRGLCSGLVRYWQERAGREKVPIWLEATTEKSARLYTKLGFETIEVMRLGRGKVMENGLPPGKEEKTKGKVELQGVPVWGMVWWPEGVKPAR